MFMKNKFTGVMNVFKFSYMQILKSKVFIISTLIFMAAALLALPISTAISRAGKDEVKIRSGTYRCLKFVPVVQEGRIFKAEEDMIVWISDDKNRIPILAQAKVLVGSIKMQLVKYDNLSHPIAKIK